MKTYRAKPIEVQAVQVTKVNVEKLHVNYRKGFSFWRCHKDCGRDFSFGDWLVAQENRPLYGVWDDDFKERFEEV